MSYTILAAAVESTIEEKNSEFLTFLHPVTSREEAMVWVEHYRQQYPDAAHVCWAYVIGNTRQPLTQAFSDDGEPSGTAGKPMLHVLTEREVGNALAVVVRYFGGVKLGAGGLVRAYSSAVSNAVNSSTLAQVIPSQQLRIHVDFAREARVRHIITQYQGVILDVSYADQVSLQMSLPVSQITDFTRQVINETAGTALIEQNDTH